MVLGKIVGTVVCTQKDDKLLGLKFYVGKKIGLDLSQKDDFVVAVDAVGSGVGEVVLYASGSSARQTKVTDGKPVDATIMAIVDSFDSEGSTLYQKE